MPLMVKLAPASTSILLPTAKAMVCPLMVALAPLPATTTASTTSRSAVSAMLNAVISSRFTIIASWLSFKVKNELSALKSRLSSDPVPPMVSVVAPSTSRLSTFESAITAVFAVRIESARLNWEAPFTVKVKAFVKDKFFSTRRYLNSFCRKFNAFSFFATTINPLVSLSSL